jgi:hypothetical protein
MDRISGSDNVCIKDLEIASITEISGDCSETDEVALKCDGTEKSGYVCVVEDGRYKILGLLHSGVLEYAPKEDSSSDTKKPSTSGGGSGGGSRSCVSNWECTEWSECINTYERRTCVDTNNCRTDDSPETTRSCEPELVIPVIAQDVAEEGQQDEQPVQQSNEQARPDEDLLPFEDIQQESEEQDRKGGLAAITGAFVGIREKTGDVVGVVILAVVMMSLFGAYYVTRKSTGKRTKKQ